MVDDDETTIFLNKLFLQNLTPELEINTAENGEEALDFLRAHLDDPEFGHCLLVLDIEMPIMDGWQFLRAYEEEFSEAQRSKVTVAVLSIHSNDEIAKRAAQYPSVTEVLAKPLSDAHFQKVINRHFPGFLEHVSVD
ncbi:response regulator [Allomuricauda sp. SCSIO 65647]|uniref:response regulator n=1 Tax=Allomuricauda sp. SCSIO 65647 TaxID=2908843 RepID=UPI001F47C0B4|nr:response regulator [Muricauda sp. SCSIO 65647]UJH67408.1 response regulator [Muricauda sp. SCSIO 65647]